MRMSAAILCLLIPAAAAVTGCKGLFHHSEPAKASTVTLFYGAGYNNLSSDIEKNLNTIKEGYVPSKKSGNKLLTFTHLSLSDANFSTPTEGYLVQHSKDGKGRVHSDTLLTIASDRTAADPEVMREVLETTASLYPEASIGMIVSSHGTGWLPAGVYGSSSYRPIQYSQGGKRTQEHLPIYNHDPEPGEPKVKTFISEVLHENSVNYSQEMSIQSMAKAISVHLDYLIFDACLMGCIEVAYELKDCADLIGFSPTEVLSSGFNFSDLSMLIRNNPDPRAFCEAYFDMYNARSGSFQSATITLVRTDALDGIAGACRTFLEKYRAEILALNVYSGVQPYFRGSNHWFYDLEDIFVKAGIIEGDRQSLNARLDDCIIYKAATPSFLSIKIDTYSGLSMYLPGAGSSKLDEFYRTLAWNKAVNLVE